jgi:DNA polymerase III subunit gamma/tau
MSLITQRPSSWASLVGQKDSVTLIQAILRNLKHFTSGVILYGNFGVGKTSAAQLMAKALMCTGVDLTGCGKCSSCINIQQEGIQTHPDYHEINASEVSGVDAAKTLVDSLSEPPLGRYRVAIIDEAHCLSKEAWNVYLSPLEKANSKVAILFVTSDFEKISRAITSRCIKIPFTRVPESVILGYLSAKAAENKIDYDLDALKIIAASAKGNVRDALQWLSTSATLGRVTTHTVGVAIDIELQDLCYAFLLKIGNGDLSGCIQTAEMLTNRANPQRAVEIMLELYARAVFSDDERLTKLYVGLPSVKAITEVLLKWSSAPLHADVLTLVAYELVSCQGKIKPSPVLKPIATPAPAPPKPVNQLSMSLADYINADMDEEVL